MKKSELYKIIKETKEQKVPQPGKPAAQQSATPADVNRLNKTLDSSTTTKTAFININDRNELRKTVPVVFKDLGPNLQPNKLSLANIMSDIKAGLIAAGYK
jgi:hypothetical protein